MDRPAPEAFQPRRTLWGEAWRLVLCLVFSAVGWLTIVERQSSFQWILDVTAGLVCYVLVFAYRRRAPVPVALAASLLSAVSGIAGGPAVLALVSVATRRRWREIAVVGAVSFTAVQLFATWQPSGSDDSWWLILSVNVVGTAAMLGWGMYIGSRRELVWTLRHRAERAEAEQELRVAQARANERARIAREMHDVLAHRISQISMHAGALAFREDLTAPQMRDSAGLIREKAHEALTDLRGVLGVLRDADGELALAPQPTFEDLPDLVSEARESGLNVSFDAAVARPEELPDVVGRTVYRIVQEGITNARKHAPGTLLSIRVSGSPDDGLAVELRNPLGFGSSTPGSGLGLVGLSERAELRGGRLEHRYDGASFVLQGWIPWAA